MTRYIHLTDIHFWRIVYNPLLLMNKRMLGNANLILRRRRHIKTALSPSLIDVLGGLEVDAVLVGGDITTTATDAEFQLAVTFLKKIEDRVAPVYLVAGNHDRYTFESHRKRRLERYCHAYLPASEAPDYLVLPGGMPLLRIPTARPNLLSSRGYVSEEQVGEVAKLIREESPAPLIALAHYPLLTRTQGYRTGITRRLGHSEMLRKALGGTGMPLLYLAGHVHVFSHARDPQYPHLEQVTTSALFYGKKGGSGGFTEIVGNGGNLSVYPWTFRGGWERESLSHPVAPE